MRAVFDTNILIDFLNGHEQARHEVRSFPERAISIITWVEVLARATTDTELECRTLLSVFVCVDLTPAIAEKAVILRRQQRLKLPDAVVWATAQVDESILITRDARNFPSDEPGIRIPYQL